MAESDSKPTINVSQAPGSTGGSGGGLYFIVGALVVVVLAGGYFLMGMPGLHGGTASAPGAPSSKVDITIQQPAAPAAPAASAAPKK